MVRLAAWHGVATQVAARLRTLGLMPLVPEAVRSELERRVREGSFVAITQAAALGEIQAAMNDADIDLVAWKGPALSKDLYGAYALRSSSDLDFLVAPQMMAVARNTLERLHFVPRSAWSTHAATERDAHMNCEVQLFRARDRVHVELHDEIMPRLFGKGMPIDQCISRSRWMNLHGQTRVRVLAPNDLLVSLCVHGSKHGWERLKWVCDVAGFLVRHGERVDWDELLANARRASSLEAVLGGIRLAEKVLATTQPEAVRRYRRHAATVQRSVTMVAADLALGAMEPRSVRLALRDALHTAGTGPAKARYLLRRLLTVNALDVEQFRLPKGLGMLYYPLHAVRVVRKALWA